MFLKKEDQTDKIARSPDKLVLNTSTGCLDIFQTDHSWLSGDLVEKSTPTNC